MADKYAAFISYAHRDGAWVRALQENLEFFNQDVLDALNVVDALVALSIRRQKTRGTVPLIIWRSE